MKQYRTWILTVFVYLLALNISLTPVSALAATMEDARGLMAECGIGDPVAQKDNLMDISLQNVHYDKDGDVYIQWNFANKKMRSNLTYAFTQMRFFDPANLAAPYAAFKVNADNTLKLTIKKGDVINILDFVHLNHEEFSPASGVIFMYFNGSGDGAPEELFTKPLTFTIYVDGQNPRAVETTPRYAPEAMVAAFAGK